MYVGSANSEDYDQELDSCMGKLTYNRVVLVGRRGRKLINRAIVGPVPVGVNAFDFIAPAPAHHLLPSDHPDDVMGVTVIIIAAAYRDKEFVRVGYYVNTYYEDEKMMEEPGTKVEWDKLHRNVLIEKPKVTRYVLKPHWDEHGRATDTPRAGSQTAGIPDRKRAMTRPSMKTNPHKACRQTCSLRHPFQHPYRNRHNSQAATAVWRLISP